MRPIKGLFTALIGAALYAGGGGSAYADVVAPSPSICPITPPPIESGSTPTYPGRFWNPNRYGTGWDFLYDDRLGMNGLFVLYWFTFDASGKPTWLIAWPSEVNSADGHKRFAGKLKKAWWDGTKVSQVTDVGSVAVTIPNGTSTRAAVTWQWNEAGASEQTECLYDYFRDTVPPGPRTDTLNQAYTANWFDDELVATQPGSYGSWGFDLVIGIDGAQNYTKIITPQIFDTSGNPVWLQSRYSYGASNAPPKDNRSPDPRRVQHVRPTHQVRRSEPGHMDFHL